jgi:hypothetical protein
MEQPAAADSLRHESLAVMCRPAHVVLRDPLMTQDWQKP